MSHKRGQQPSSSTRNKTRARLKAIGAPCHICGQPIDYSLDWYTDPRDGKRKRHPMSFEWDHDRPKARGGTDDWANAKPAHRICNQRKGDGRPKRSTGPQDAAGGAFERDSAPSTSELPTSRRW